MKKKGTLIERPKAGVFLKKKMEQGGWSKASEWGDENKDALASGAGFGAAAIDALAYKDEYGVTSNGAALGSGALSGAATGLKTAGLPGAAVGAVIGGVTGILGNKSAQRKKDAAILQKNTAQKQATEQAAQARLAGDPSLKYGKMQASYYRFGGTMKTPGFTAPRITPAMPVVQAKPRLMPDIATVPTRQKSKYANGGNLETISSQDVKIEGPSHAAGGVPIPALGAELEGGETVNNGFVFSKKLGFAKPAEKLGRALGKAEQRPNNDINRATVKALNRKTDFLKVQQEQAKEAAGIPNDMPTMADGGPLKGDGSVLGNWGAKALNYLQSPQTERSLKRFKKKGEVVANTAINLVDQTGISNYPDVYNDFKTGAPAWQTGLDLIGAIPVIGGKVKGPAKVIKSLTRLEKATKAGGDLVHGAIDLAKKANGGPTMRTDSIPKRQVLKLDKNLTSIFAQSPTGMVLNGGIPMPGSIPMSDKATGVSNNYYPARDGSPAGTPAILKSPTGRTYKFGGKLNKMADGGDPSLLNGVTIRSTATRKTPRNIGTTVGKLPGVKAVNVLPSFDPAIPQPKADTPSFGAKVANGFEKAAPFLSNFINATQKLPLPPIPTLNEEITPNLVDYSSSRAEAVRAIRGANEAAQRNLNSGAAVASTAAANLSQQVRSVGQINEAENNANAGIRNQTAAQNAGIKASNNTLKNNYQNELTERQLKQQELTSENWANITDKIQGMSRDKKLFDLEDQKVMLGYLQNSDSGAGYSAARGIFAKHLSAESLAALDKEVAKMKKARESERADTMKTNKLQLDYLKRRNGATPDSIMDVIGKGISTVNTAKEDNAADKTKRK